MYVDTQQASQATSYVAPRTRKPKVMSLEGLIAWLETQQPRTQYLYSDIHDCLLTRYFKARGMRYVFCGPTIVNYAPVFFLPPLFFKCIPFAMNLVALHNFTYGGALKTARELV